MIQIKSGVLSQSARTEIVQTLATLIWTNTHFPSPEAYKKICMDLITKYPNLADDADDNSAPYVSFFCCCCLFYLFLYFII